MYKLPKPLLIFIFTIVLCLLFCVIILVRMNFEASIVLTEQQFYIIFGIISIISFLAGIVIIFPFKSWTIEELVDRIDNLIKINSTIIALQSRKAQLKSDIPDPVRVTIESHDIGGGKK